MRRIHAGDRLAEKELVLRYGTGLRGLLHHWFGFNDHIEDYFQTTFLTVLEKIRAGQVRYPEKIANYINQVGKNLYRAAGRKRAKVEFAEQEQDLDQLFHPGRDPQMQLELEEEIQWVYQILNELKSERDRAVLMRYYVGGEPKHLIQSDLNVDAAGLNQILTRARKRFRLLWETAQSNKGDDSK